MTLVVWSLEFAQKMSIFLFGITKKIQEKPTLWFHRSFAAMPADSWGSIGPSRRCKTQKSWLVAAHPLLSSQMRCKFPIWKLQSHTVSTVSTCIWKPIWFETPIFLVQVHYMFTSPRGSLIGHSMGDAASSSDKEAHLPRRGSVQRRNWKSQPAKSSTSLEMI